MPAYAFQQLGLITADHVKRAAILYVCQSSPEQIR
jgi:hypothetical protein